MIKYISRIFLLAVFTLIGFGAVQSQQPKPDEHLAPLSFLLGDWVGEGNGQPGEAKGGSSFNLDLQGKVLIRKNYADYPATQSRPAFSHQDLMIIYFDAATKGLRANYFDNEGHAIQYVVSQSPDQKVLTLISDPTPSAPRFRFVYSRVSENSLSLQFDIAPPGQPDAFAKYTGGTIVRKPAH